MERDNEAQLRKWLRRNEGGERAIRMRDKGL